RETAPASNPGSNPAFDSNGWITLAGPTAQVDDDITYHTTISNRGLLPSNLTLIESTARADDSDGGARQVRQQARLRPWLANPPPAPLLVRGDIDLRGAIALVNDEPGGVLAWSGGRFQAPGATLSAASPRCPPTGICALDARLAALSSSDLFAQLYARTPASLRALVQNEVQWLESSSQPIPGSIEASAQESIVLDGAHIGSAQFPALVIVNGNLEVRGNVEIDGVLHITGDWLPGSGTLTVRGALIVSGNALHTESATLQYAPEYLARLATSGHYARIAGSWHDF
ncbi:MAG: hypothetical protein LBV36_06625, partial [Chromatiales bacterium]|nr:hypothetical protein [Chromatiales bacterium]